MNDSSDHFKRKRDETIRSGSVSLHGLDRSGHAPDNTAIQESAAALLQSLLDNSSGNMHQQQQGFPQVPPPSSTASSSNQDQIQNLLNLLNSSNNGQLNQQPANPPATKVYKPQMPHVQQATTSATDTSTPLNYEIASLLASLNNQNATDAQHFYNSVPCQVVQPQQESTRPMEQNQQGIQNAIETLLRNMDTTSRQQQGYPMSNTQPFAGGPFHMMSQHQSHTETQTSSSSNQFVQPGFQVDNGNPFQQGLMPNSVQQTTNTSNLDVFRLLLLSSQPTQQQQMPAVPQDNNAALNNLILQSLGLSVPAPAPVVPQVDPNIWNTLLGQIALNPGLLSTGANAPQFHSSPIGNSGAQQNGLRDTDDSSTDTCELAGVAPIPMSTQSDEGHVSNYQCLVRKQIQFFEATQADVASTAQGRNKPIVLGQVGIQCRHCVKVPPKLRARGAVYFPSKFSGIYQAAQNMASAHFTLCSEIHESVKEQLFKLKEGKSTAGGGKKFWGESAADLGVYEDRNGLRFKNTAATRKPPAVAEDPPTKCVSASLRDEV